MKPSQFTKSSTLLFLLVMLFSCNNPSEEDYQPFLNYQAEVKGQTLTSTKFPKGSITFDDDLTYIGSETFILYKVASCEIHLFGELGDNGKYKRLYWVQYEGYLPKNLLRFPLNLKPGALTYDYSGEPYSIEMGGKPFYTKPYYMAINETDEQLSTPLDAGSSDFDHVIKLLAQNNVNINADVLGVRMVHLNESKEKELMIIYYEVMDGKEINLKKLKEAGKESPFWAEISQRLLERVQEGMTLQFD